MEERPLFDRDKLLQQLHAEQPVQTAQPEHHAQYDHCGHIDRDGRRIILNGLSAGVDEHILLSYACSAIAELTGDTAFRDEAAELIRIVYDPEYPTDAETLEGLHHRTKRLEAFLTRSDIPAVSRAAAERALTAHRRETAKFREAALRGA